MKKYILLLMFIILASTVYSLGCGNSSCVPYITDYKTNLLRWYPMNETGTPATLKDYSQTSKDLDQVNAVTQSFNNPYNSSGKALDFDNVFDGGGYAKASYLSQDLFVSDMTICGWFKPLKASDANEQRFWRGSQGLDNGNDDWLIRVTNTNYDTQFGFPAVYMNTQTNLPVGKWSLFCVQRNGSSGYFWLDGVMIYSNTMGSDAETDVQLQINAQYDGTNKNNFAGNRSDNTFWNKTLTTAEILCLYNGTGCYVPPAAQETPSYVAPTPSDGDVNDTQVIINATCATTDVSIWFGDTNPPTTLVTQNMTGYANYTTNVGVDDTYYYRAGCSDGGLAGVRSWVYDTTNPDITINNNNFWGENNITQDIYKKSLFRNITFSDNNALFAYNLTIKYIDGTVYLSEQNESLSGTTWKYITNTDITSWPLGKYSVNLTLADSHTNNKIKDYDFKISLNSLEFNTSEGNIIKLNSDENVQFSTNKLEDRYLINIEYNTAEKNKERTVYVSCDNDMVYLPNSKYQGHFVCGDAFGGNWLDFVTSEPLEEKIKVKEVEKNLYEVTFKTKDKVVQFESIGGLNVNTRLYSFNISNLTMMTSISQPSLGLLSDDLKAYCSASEGQSMPVSYNIVWYMNNTIMRTYNESVIFDYTPESIQCPWYWGIFNCTQTGDGDFSTYGGKNRTTPGSYYIYMNYTIPANTVNASILTKFGCSGEQGEIDYYSSSWINFYSGCDDLANVTNKIPDAALSGDTLFLRFLVARNFVFDYVNLYDNIITWYGNFGDHTANTSVLIDTLGSGNTSVGQNWAVECTPYSLGHLGTSLLSSNSTVYNIGMDDCSKFNSRILWFFGYDENNITRLNLDIYGLFNISYAGGEKIGYNITGINITNLSICVFPNITFSLDAYIQYEESYERGKRERYYFENVSINQSAQQTVGLYNFEGTDGLSDLKAILYNYYYQPYQNVLMKMQRYYPGTSLWRTVQIDKSDEFGRGIFYVYQNSYDYRFIWEQEGTILGITEPLKFKCDSTTDCEQSFTIIETSESSRYDGMSEEMIYNNITGMISFTWYDTNGLVSSVRLLVQKNAYSGLIDICDTTVASSSGTILCNISAYDGVIQVQAMRSSSPLVPFFIKVIEKPLAKIRDVLAAAGKSEDGTFYSMLITFGAIGFGAATGSPIAIIVLGILSMIINYFIGLTSIITLGVTISFVAVGVVVAFIIKR